MDCALISQSVQIVKNSVASLKLDRRHRSICAVDDDNAIDGKDDNDDNVYHDDDENDYDDEDICSPAVLLQAVDRCDIVGRHL